MTEPAKVYKVHPSAYKVVLGDYQPLKSLLIDGKDVTDYFTSVSFDQRDLTLHKFATTIYIDHESYYEMSKEYLDREYERFYNGLVDNCKTLYIKDPEFKVFYDALRHQDVVSWSVLAGSDQIDYFKDLFKCHERHYDDLAVREVTTVIDKFPETLRDCFKQAWYIIKRRFRHDRVQGIS